MYVNSRDIGLSKLSFASRDSNRRVERGDERGQDISDTPTRCPRQFHIKKQELLGTFQPLVFPNFAHCKNPSRLHADVCLAEKWRLGFSGSLARLDVIEHIICMDDEPSIYLCFSDFWTMERMRCRTDSNKAPILERRQMRSGRHMKMKVHRNADRGYL